MASNIFPDKDPDDVLDYAFDFRNGTPPVLQVGETITAHTVTVTGDMTVDSTSEAGGVVLAWLSGGTAGETYIVTCEINTSSLRTYERSARLAVKEL